MIITVTERLILCEQTADDAPFMLELLNTAGWLQYIGDRGVRTVEDTVQYIEGRIRKGYAAYGFGFYTVRLKKDNTPIGICGLVKRAGLDHPDIGFAFLPAYTANGYGYESASAVMQYAKEKLVLNTIAAITTKNNLASIGLLEKLGLQLKGFITLPDEKEELMLFERHL